jgi:hypothetical protein
MEQLFASLSARKRPEDVADRITSVLGGTLTGTERGWLERAARGSLRRQFLGYTSMLQDFARPVGLERQVARAQTLFESAYELNAADCSEPARVEAFLRRVCPEIRKTFGRSEFAYDRLTRAVRRSVGLEISRRKYNRKFRHLVRMEKSSRKLVREWKKYEFTRVGKSALATRITWSQFASCRNSACFIAYYVARCNLRSEFTVSGQQRPFDEIASMLFERCKRDPETNWFAIAHAYPAEQVLAHLTEEQRGLLLGVWFTLLRDIAEFLREIWSAAHFDPATMVVHRGDDSTTWNNTANAWNTARNHWLALVRALGCDSLLDELCPGTVLRLMAADVVAWHFQTGGRLSPDTAVWAALPLPWDVLSGRRVCGRELIEQACTRHGVDPIKHGWTGPRPTGHVSRYQPTPELVHGVVVASPELATVLKKAGWFSGKGSLASAEPHELHAQILFEHCKEKERCVDELN